MKKVKLLSFVLSVVLLLCSLTACEFKVNLDGDDESTTQGTTAENNSTDETEVVTEIETQVDDNGNVVTNKSGEAVTKVNTVTKKKTASAKADEFFTINESKKSEKETIKKDRIVKKENTTKQSEKETTKQEEQQNDVKIIENRVYTIKGRMYSDGEVSEFKMAQNGDKFSLATYYDGTPMAVILNGDNILLLDTETKTYFTIPMQYLEDNGGTEFADMIKGNISEDDSKIIKTGKETVDGIELSYKEYEDGSKTYYSGTTIVLTKSSDGTLVYIDEISDSADDSLFTPPADYESVELDVDALNKYKDE